MKTIFVNLLVCLALVGLCGITSAANILAIFPMPSLSHHFLGYTLVQELVNRQHNVTFITTYPARIPKEDIQRIKIISVESNLKQFDEYTKSSSLDPGVTMQTTNEAKKSFFHREDQSPYEAIIYLNKLSYQVAESTLSNKNVQGLLKSDSIFDLILMEYFLNEAYLAIGPHYKAPTVLFSTLPTSTFNNYLVANPGLPSYVPHILSPYTSDMDLWERFQNSMIWTFDVAYKHLVMIPKHRELVNKYVSQDINIDDILYNTNLMLVNSHPSVNTAVPHAKNVIEIGGFHIRDPGDSNKSSEKLLFDENDDVILFSMGSNLNSVDMPPEKIDGLIKAFSEFPCKFIWKWETNPPKINIKNIMFVKWFPQQKYLALPNVKAFITHGGLLSMIEAVHYGVPVIGIPIYGDQKMNIATAVQDGYAVMVPYKNLSQETMATALREIISNETYTTNVKFRSRILRDRPQDPLQCAIYWIEYVIRNNGAHHLKSPALKLVWYKRNMIEIVIILTLITIVLFILFYIIIKHIIHCGRQPKDDSKKRN